MVFQTLGDLATLYYVRSYTILGDSWAPPVIVAAIPNIEISEAIVLRANRRPAIFLHYNDRLVVYRSEEQIGSIWPTTPTTIRTITSSFRFFGGQIADGVPALLYTENDVAYHIRSNNGEGTSWQSPRQLFGGASVLGKDLQQGNINGRPVAVYATGARQVAILRANDSRGTSWPAMSSAVYIDLSTAPGVGNGTSTLPDTHRMVQLAQYSGSNALFVQHEGGIDVYKETDLVGQNFPSTPTTTIPYNGQFALGACACLNTPPYPSIICPVLAGLVDLVGTTWDGNKFTPMQNINVDFTGAGPMPNLGSVPNLLNWRMSSRAGMGFANDNGQLTLRYMQITVDTHGAFIAPTLSLIALLVFFAIMI